MDPDLGTLICLHQIIHELAETLSFAHSCTGAKREPTGKVNREPIRYEKYVGNYKNISEMLVCGTMLHLGGSRRLQNG